MTRTSMLVAVFAVAMMLGPSLLLGNQDLSPANNASAVDPSRVLRIGWPGFYSNIGTLNPHTMTMGQEFMLILACYSTLLTYDVNNQVINDLATKYEVTNGGKDWHFWIVQTASFYNKNTPAVQVPLTTEDVIFSFYLAQNSSISIMNYYFPDDPVTGAPLMTSITKVSNYELIFHLRESFSPFMSALVGVPILPKYIWDGKPVGWANYDHTYPPCVGSGPYYYALDNIAQIQDYGSSNIMNPTWFGLTERGWQPKAYEFKVKSETDASGISNFEAGNLDVLISPTPAQYAAVVPGGINDVKKFTSSQGFVLDMCINQLTPLTAAKYGMSGMGNQLLLDPVVKYALKASVDKTTVVSAALLGGGSPADSLMPSSSVWYYNYGSNPTRDTNNGRGVIPDGGDVYAARHALYDAGWMYTPTSPTVPVGRDDLTATPLAKYGGTAVLSFRYQYCDWYSFIMAEGPYIQDWAADAGIELVGGPATSASMNSAWASGDFDVYLWDWWFSPNSEPSLDVMELYTSNSIANNTDVNDYSPDVYDPMYFESLTTSDFATRKALLDEMQRWAYENSGYWPVAYRDNLYLAQTVAPNYWTNYGDWNSHYGLCPDSNLFWLYVTMYPRDQPAPSVSMTIYDSTTTLPVTYQVDVSDTPVGSILQFKWIWGDGTNSGWVGDVNVSHTYATDGLYEARLLVRETNSIDGYISYAKDQLIVVDVTNTPPSVNAWTPSPSNPTLGELVYFNGSAIDAQGDSMTYSWNFGDGTTADGQFVTHRFSTATGTYSVTLSVDDGRYGTGTRPATKTQSIQVTANNPPIVNVGDYGSVDKAQTYTFSVTASDSNVRDVLQYTWVWGDGTANTVTTTKSTRHSYKFTGLYTLTVWADDQTGLAGHNVSDTGQINVVPPSTNHAPTMGTTGFLVDDTEPWVSQVVVFFATASDADGDILDVTFTFGDGATQTVTQGDPNSTVTASHSYATADVWFPSVTFTDTIAAAITRSCTDMSPAWFVTSTSFTIDLVVGWNFVSFPVTGAGLTAADLPLDFGDEICGYNPLTGAYDKVYFPILSPPEDNFAIEGSTGYWIYSGAVRTLTPPGTVPTTMQSRVIDVPPSGGWAIIGIDSFSTTRLASDIVSMYPADGIDVIVEFDPVTGSYMNTYFVVFNEGDFTLKPGWAYWAFFNFDGTLAYMP